MTKRTFSQALRDVAHKGHLIRTSLLGDCWFIIKDGVSIGTFQSFDAAKACIDTHLAPQLGTHEETEMAYVIMKNSGLDVGADFARATEDTPIELAPDEFARRHHVIGYIAGNPESLLGFMRTARVRVHVQKRALREV